MTRPSTGRPALDSARQPVAADLVTAKVERRCTRNTVSQSSGDMFTSAASRSTPALLTTMSSPPNSVRARSTMRVAPSMSEASLVSVTAIPPAARISATTSSASDEWAGAPSSATPRSLTTTLAP